MSLAGKEAREHDKRIRAEVLAACRAKVNVRIHNAQCSGLPGDIQDVSLLSLVRQDLEQLQPAASALEELLQQASENAIADIANRIRKSACERETLPTPIVNALEELLREAELEGLDFCHPSFCYPAGKGNKPNFDYPCCFVGKRIAELEKAHTSEETGR